jgi:hypothetical protein
MARVGAYLLACVFLVSGILTLFWPKDFYRIKEYKPPKWETRGMQFMGLLFIVVSMVLFFLIFTELHK